MLLSNANDWLHIKKSIYYTLIYIYIFCPYYRAFYFWILIQLHLAEIKKHKHIRYVAREFAASLIAEFCRLRTSRQRVCPLPPKVYTACLAPRRANSHNGRNSHKKIRFRSARWCSFFPTVLRFFPFLRVAFT